MTGADCAGIRACRSCADTKIAKLAPDGGVYLISDLPTRIRTDNFRTGPVAVDAIGADADEMAHHPDLDPRYTYVGVRSTSHDTGGVTERDIRLASRISTIAAGAGVTLHSDGLSRLKPALDTPTPRRPAVAPTRQAGKADIYFGS